MNISGTEQRGYHVVELVGKIDRLKDSIALKSHINTLLDSGSLKVALSLSKVTYLDSGALNVLIYAHNALKKKGGGARTDSAERIRAGCAGSGGAG